MTLSTVEIKASLSSERMRVFASALTPQERIIMATHSSDVHFLCSSGPKASPTSGERHLTSLSHPVWILKGPVLEGLSV